MALHSLRRCCTRDSLDDLSRAANSRSRLGLARKAGNRWNEHPHALVDSSAVNNLQEVQGEIAQKRHVLTPSRCPVPRINASCWTSQRHVASGERGTYPLGAAQCQGRRAGGDGGSYIAARTPYGRCAKRSSY